MFGENRTKIVREEVVDLHSIRLIEPNGFEKLEDDFIPYQKLEFQLTDYFRVGYVFQGDITDRELVRVLRELAIEIENHF